MVANPGGTGGSGKRTGLILTLVGLLLLGGIGGAVALLAGGEGDDGPVIADPSESPSEAPTAEPTDLDIADLAEALAPAVWQVESSGCGFVSTGTAWAIDEFHLVTNRHVVDVDATPVLYDRNGGNRMSGEVIGWSAYPDIAVIEVDERLDVVLEWAPTADLREGESLVTLGYPAPAGDFTVTPGTILSFQTDEGVRQAIRTDGLIDRGNSGGPALDDQGRVAGVVTEMAFNEGGLQLFPLVFTQDAVGDTVEDILDGPDFPQPDCDGAGEVQEVPDWFEGAEDHVPDPDVYTFGDDATLDAMWTACEAGDWFACDELFRVSPYGSEYETFADSCGYRNEPAGWCVSIYEGDAAVADTYGDDPALDVLWDACAAGDMQACDDLFSQASYGSEYEVFADTCGYRSDGGVWCTELYPNGPPDGGGNGASGEQVSVFELAVGDCWNAANSTDETFNVSTVERVSCDQLHDNEIFAIFLMDDGPYPGDEAVRAEADEGCVDPRFADYVGEPYATSIYYAGALWPSESTWADGDREIVCYLNLGDGGGQAQGSAWQSGQ